VLDFNFRSRTEEEERPRAVYILSEYNTLSTLLSKYKAAMFSGEETDK
jgi:hypothetical protein